MQILKGMLVWRTAESTSLSQCSESGGLRVVVLEFCASRLFYSLCFTLLGFGEDGTVEHWWKTGTLNTTSSQGLELYFGRLRSQP